MKQRVEEFSSGIPVFQHGGLHTLPGGYRLSIVGLTLGYVIPAGSAFVADDETRIATLVKSAKLTAVAADNATTYQVAKGHAFNVGDTLTSKKGTKSIGITEINRGNASYDVLTLTSTLGIALAIGDKLLTATNIGASSVTQVASGLSYNDVKVELNATLTLAYTGLFYERRIPAVPAEVKAALPRITFSQSH